MRKFVEKSDFFILLIIISFIFMVWAIMFWYGSKNNQSDTIAVIYKNREIYDKINLTQTEDGFIKINGANVKLQIKDNKIAFVDAVCFDKICENTGFINNTSQIAVCAPEQVAIVITSENKQPINTENEVDAVAR